MSSGDNTPARLSALEAHVSTLAELVGATLAAVGKLNAHVAITREAGDGLAEFRQRVDEIQRDVQGLYAKLEAIWPEAT